MDYCLRLYPLPDLVVIADQFQQFALSQHECLFANPGSFARSQLEFHVYYPSAGEIEPSSVNLWFHCARLFLFLSHLLRKSSFIQSCVRQLQYRFYNVQWTLQYRIHNMQWAMISALVKLVVVTQKGELNDDLFRCLYFWFQLSDINFRRLITSSLKSDVSVQKLMSWCDKVNQLALCFSFFLRLIFLNRFKNFLTMYEGIVR